MDQVLAPPDADAEVLAHMFGDHTEEERDERIIANSLSSATWSFNLAIGSALGGLVAGTLGLPYVGLVRKVVARGKKEERA